MFNISTQIRLTKLLAAVAAVAMIAVTLYLIQGISNGANVLNEKKDRQLIVSALAGLLDGVAGLVADNAESDDAVDNTYGTANQKWIFDTWSANPNNGNYDYAFVLTADGSTVSGFKNASNEPLSALEVIGLGLQGLIDALPADAKNNAQASDFVLTARGPAILAASPILPISKGKTIPEAPPRILVFAKMMTPDVVANLGGRLAMQDLKLFTSPQKGDSSLPIEGIDGQYVGYLSWAAERPGDIAGSAIRGPAIVALLAMLASFVLLTFFSSRLAGRLQKSEHIAWRIANLDVLSGLPNRLAAVTKLEGIVKKMRDREGTVLAVVLADLDDFKEVNDTYGHDVGDALLKSVAAEFKTIADRYTGTLCRLGGDEFTVFFEDPDAVQCALGFSEAALRFLAEPLDILGRNTLIGMSIGISTLDAEHLESLELVRRADIAMYEAKKSGKNQLRIYEPKLDADRNNKIAMAKDLTFALANNQIAVHYQPIVEARTRRIVGAEALARWQRQDGSMVPPDQFIPIAEEFGLVDRLGSQVLGIACRDAVAWPDIELSVNISPVQLRKADFVREIIATLDGSGLDRDRLELEVTEGCLIANEHRAKPVIEALQAQGVNVALDDYGTGYSSIGYLRKYNFNRLKIDKSLVCGMISDSSSRSIVQAVAAVAHSMNMQITAEGVEDEGEAKMLYLVGCTALQGWLFGRPQTAASFSALLAKINSCPSSNNVGQIAV